MTSGLNKNINLLGISVGNSRTKIGAFVEGELVDIRTFENGDRELLALEAQQAYGPLKHRDGVVLLGSVNPPVSQWLVTDLQARLDQQILRVEKDLVVPVGRQLDPEAIVGEDRLLNAAAAFHVLRQACVVIDAGTAITVDFVDGAGTFHGGAIAPGAQLMLDALHEHTAQLPEVQFETPAGAIGHNTVQAMLCGVHFGLRGLVRELTEQYAEIAGAYPMVVATGGNASTLFAETDLVERIVPDLTLLGLAYTFQSGGEREDEEA